MSYQDVLILSIIMAAIALVLILLVFEQKLYLTKMHQKHLTLQSLLSRRYIFMEKVDIRCSNQAYLKNLFILMQRAKLSNYSLAEAYAFLYQKGVIQRWVKRLSSASEYRRKKAVAYLSLFNHKDLIRVLSARLTEEPRYHIKLMIINSLKRHIDKDVFHRIVESLINSKRFYQQRVVKILKKYIHLDDYDLSDYFDSPYLETHEVLSEIAGVIVHPAFEKYLAKTLKDIEHHYAHEDIPYLKNQMSTRVDRLYRQTLSALAGFYGFNLGTHKYLGHYDADVVRIAVDSLVEKGTMDTIKKLASYASMTPRDRIFIDGIIRICDRDHSLYTEVYDYFNTHIDRRKRYLLAAVLSKKIDYLILSVENEDELTSFIRTIVNSGYTVNLINWLNQNKNEDIEKRLIKIITPIAKDNYDFYLEMNSYLDSRIFRRMGFVTLIYPKSQAPEAEPETRKFRWLLTILIVTILSVPLLFILTNLGWIFHSDILTILTAYIVDINLWFIAYYVFINLTYIIFALIAFFEFRKQKHLWDIKSHDYLYEDGIVEPISIIVPAYNESMTIVESIRSLLSLEYPVYEVIVVNDGSKDQTLQTVIDAFELKRADYTNTEVIKTNQVRAIYKNRFYDKLLLVDKDNGGKADALNVGINFSKYEYVCGIDADSIIESDALLKMMSSVLDNDEITLALGGSIVPVNGSIVDHGFVEKYRIPKSFLTRAQTVEYIRAFNTGRLAFSRMKCLLIISGAFGLFEKRTLIKIGGYLSASSFKKKTVGEDMELVVRMTRKATESHLEHRVKYVPMARCYTEVPSKLGILLHQRNRWQRGLIETLSFHRSMILNPGYGSRGLLGMPYFFLFEMIAPLLELQIYASLLIGLIFGIFNGVFLLLLMSVTVLLGIILSMTSLLVQERYAHPLSVKDTLVMIFFAIIENFGWRQFINIYRSMGFFSSLKGRSSWGTMSRTGFNK